MHWTSPTNPPDESRGKGARAKRTGASGRTIRGRIAAVLARSLRRPGRKVEPNPHPISREVDF